MNDHPNIYFKTEHLQEWSGSITKFKIDNIVMTLGFNRTIPREYLAKNLLNVSLDTEKSKALVWRAPKGKGSLTFFVTKKAGFSGGSDSFDKTNNEVKKRIDYLNKILPLHEEKIIVTNSFVTNTICTMYISHNLNLNTIISVLPQGSWDWEPEVFPPVIFWLDPTIKITSLKQNKKKRSGIFIRFWSSGKIIIGACTSEEEIKYIRKLIEPWIGKCCRRPSYKVTIPEMNFDFHIEDLHEIKKPKLNITLKM